MKKIIIVTGTPGTGKTTYAKKLAREKRYLYVDVNNVIDDNNLSEGYDRKRRTKIVDEHKLAKVLERMIKKFKEDFREKKKGMVIDSHMSHFINPRYVDICYVTKCGLRELEKRLKKKKYRKAKVEENMQAEIFDVCHIEALERGHDTKVVRTDKAVKKKGKS